MRAATTTASAPPDWDFVPFDVTCARCGHDLRGQTEPKCPACDLTFDWSEVVPIESLTCLHCDYHLYGLTETRCPECGQHFTWGEVLAGYHRRKHPLFEYHWRERPVYSYVYSLFLILRPRKFWQRFDIHDPPAVKPLIVMAVISFIIAGIIVATLALTGAFMAQLSWRAAVGRPMGIRNVLSMGARSTIGAAVPVCLWTISSLAALMIFRQSMSRFKIRTRHVVRVWAYAVPHVLPLTAACCWGIGAAVLIPVAIGPAAPRWAFLMGRVPPNLYLAIVGLSGLHVLRLIRHGYGTYLRMWHGWGIAIASQVIAVLATATTIVAIDTL